MGSSNFICIVCVEMGTSVSFFFFFNSFYFFIFVILSTKQSNLHCLRLYVYPKFVAVCFTRFCLFFFLFIIINIFVSCGVFYVFLCFLCLVFCQFFLDNVYFVYIPMFNYKYSKISDFWFTTILYFEYFSCCDIAI